jgi:hypothetical protein
MSHPLFCLKTNSTGNHKHVYTKMVSAVLRLYDVSLVSIGGVQSVRPAANKIALTYCDARALRVDFPRQTKLTAYTRG